MLTPQDGRLSGMGMNLFGPEHFSAEEIQKMEREQERNADLARIVEIMRIVGENQHISDIINSHDPREALPLLAEITNYTTDEIAAIIFETE